MKQLVGLYYIIARLHYFECFLERLQWLYLLGLMWQFEDADNDAICFQARSGLYQQAGCIASIHAHIIDNQVKFQMLFAGFLDILFRVAPLVAQVGLIVEAGSEVGRINGDDVQASLQE